jgi:hypothetical protein
MDAQLERIRDPGYLNGLELRPIEEVRALRAECQAVETALSYLRRLVQGRLDIVLAELGHREGGDAPTEMSDMVDELPTILAEHVRSPGLGRLPTLLEPSDEVSDSLMEELDALAGADRLGRLPEMDVAEIRAFAGDLGELERSVSTRRRALHECIDKFQEEIVRRYQTGEASVETLLR